MKKKSLIIGLDGAPYHLFSKWLQENKLGFLGKLIQEGVFGILETIVPPYTMIAWPCFYTGKNPAKIGPFLIKAKGFDPDAFSRSHFLNANEIKTWTIWEYLSERGYKVGVMNVPVTYPPKKVNGFLISDFLTPKGAEDFTYPPELKEELKDYKIKSEISTGFGFADKNLDKVKLENMFYNLLEKRIHYSIKLVKEKNPDFFMIDFKEFDDFMHFFFDNKDKVYEYYKKIEECVQEIYNIMKPDVVLIMSDHGFHDAPKRYFYINRWLELKGFLKRKKSIRGRFSRFLYDAGIFTLKYFGWVRNIVSERLKFKIAREEMKKRIEWDETKVYANWYAGLYFNPKFFKNEEEKKKLAFELKEALLNLVDEEVNKKPILKAYTKYEVFKGPYFDLMPEVIYTTSPDYKINVNLTSKVFDVIVERPDIRGHHMGDLEGIYVFHGNGFKKGVRGPKLSLIDAIPNFIISLNEPLVKDMDGKIYKELFEKPPEKVEYFEKEYVPREVRKLKEEEEESIKDHLRGLGYI